MFDKPVKDVMQRRKVVKAPPQMLVSQAAELMARKNVGAVVVIEAERLVGIFTERDIAFRIVARGLDARTTRLAEVMTPAPETIDPDKPLGHALLKMHDGGFRHLPVVRDGKVVGIVSARRAMDPALEEFVPEARRRKYYREQT